MAKVALYLSPVTGQVFVQDRESFIDLEESLQSLPPALSSITCSAAAFRLQHRWWSEACGPVWLMALPAEIRVKILEYSFGFDIYPDNNIISIFGNGSDTSRGYGGTLKSVDPPTTSVLSLNKQSYRELQPYIADRLCRCFQQGETYQYYLYRALYLHVLRQLQILELDFEHREYIFAFGVDLPPFFNQDHNLYGLRMWNEGRRLTNLPALKNLFLRFRATLPRNDPWADRSSQWPAYGYGLARSSR